MSESADGAGSDKREKTTARQVLRKRWGRLVDRFATSKTRGVLNWALSPVAYEIKSACQMFVGVLTVVGLTRHYGGQILHWQIHDPSAAQKLSANLLAGVSVGLAAGAVLELAYTLFTEGPDE